MKTAGALLVFSATSVSAAIALAFPLGGLSPRLAWVSFATGLLLSIPAWKGIHPTRNRQPNAWDVLLLTLFGLASLRAFLWLIYPVGDEWRILSPNNLGDISLHLHLIRYLAGGVDFWPASPILAGVPLTYPLGVDLWNSLLLCMGIPVEKGLVWTALLGAALAGWALWRWGGAFAIAAFLFNGGLAGFLIFSTGHVADFQAELAWKNFFLTMLVTQRGLLYALPCGLFLLSVWREDFFGNGSGVPRWVAWFLYATMPLFSAHAFVFLSIILAVAFLVCPPRRKSLLAFVGAAFLPATAALFFVTGRFSASSGLRLVPGWMQGDASWLLLVKNSGAPWMQGWEPWLFWIWNFGFSLPLLLLLAWSLIWKRKKDALCFAGTGLFVFLVCCFVSFAPWEWDNTKLFLWAWLACAPFLWEILSQWPVFTRVAACFLLFFSGAVSLAGGLDGRHGYKLITRSELAETATALQSIPPGDRIAIDPEFNHPVMLLGRPVVCGYEGHLWSHGLKYREQWDTLQTVLKQGPGWTEASRTLDADWLFLKKNPLLLLRLDHPGRETGDGKNYSPKSSPTM